VELGAVHGLIEGSVANCDNVLTVSKAAVAAVRGTLGPAEMRALDDAVRMALALD
jgi:mRNA-degrading endonuclease toxin of MazEF toxin-antitoxin module